MSIPDNSSWLLRKLSLIILFSLFLRAANLIRLPEIAIPRREYCKLLGLAMTVKQLSMERHEERKTGLKSLGRVNLFVWAKRPTGTGTVASNSQSAAAFGTA